MEQIWQRLHAHWQPFHSFCCVINCLISTNQQQNFLSLILIPNYLEQNSLWFNFFILNQKLTSRCKRVRWNSKKTDLCRERSNEEAEGAGVDEGELQQLEKQVSKYLMVTCCLWHQHQHLETMSSPVVARTRRCWSFSRRSWDTSQLMMIFVSSGINSYCPARGHATPRDFKVLFSPQFFHALSPLSLSLF